jgi:hypothetical protein
MYSDDLIAEVRGDERLADAVASYAQNREELHDLLMGELPAALNQTLGEVDADEDMHTDALVTLFDRTAGLLRDRDDLLDQLRGAGLDIEAARVALECGEDDPSAPPTDREELALIEDDQGGGDQTWNYPGAVNTGAHPRAADPAHR